jgi:hypothetical protein
MPRYEIVVHVAREMECATPEQAAAVVRDQIVGQPGDPAELLHLAVWRGDRAGGASPLPPPLRRKLVDFFAALDRCAADAEAAFRDRVASVLGDRGDRSLLRQAGSDRRSAD